MKTIRIACSTKDSLPVQDLLPLQGDLKSLSKEGYAKLKKEILDTGFAFPCFVWRSGRKAYLIGGHQRARALQQLQLEGYKVPRVPVVFIEARTAKEAKRRVLQDVAQYGRVERQGLYEFMHDADVSMDDLEDSFDVPNLDLDAFRSEFFEEEESGGGGGTAADQLPVPSKATTRLGDVWQLGRHRLMCGDALSKEHLDILLDGIEPDLLFTDPPYGISVVKGGKVGKSVLAKTGLYREVLGDGSIETGVVAVRAALERKIPRAIVWGGNYFAAALPPGKKWLVWDKKRPDGTTFSDCELAWTNMEGGVKKYDYLWHGMMQEGAREERLHPTQKPVGLLKKILDDVEGRVVLDLFGGSGSTLVACEQVGRTSLIMELDADYCDVIVARFEHVTGQKGLLLTR